MTNVINSSYYATLINNNMATVSPIQSHNATRLIFVYKSDVIGVEVYLCQLKDVIKSKRRGKLRAGVLLLQDYAPLHIAQVAVAEAERYDFQLFPHAYCSPDLAPSDFNLFPKLKSHLWGRRLESDNDVICAVEGYLWVQTADFFREEITKLEHRWSKCIEVQGDYVEK